MTDRIYIRQIKGEIDRLLDRMPVSELVSDRIPDRLPDRMSDRMSDRMPERVISEHLLVYVLDSLYQLRWVTRKYYFWACPF